VHNGDLQGGGPRVCIALNGTVLTWKSAQVDGGEVLKDLPAAVRRDLVLVESVHVVPADTALATP
jgi:hypothetical protein